MALVVFEEDPSRMDSETYKFSMVRTFEDGSTEDLSFSISGEALTHTQLTSRFRMFLRSCGYAIEDDTV